MKQTDQPLVSIGLPVYNGEDYLERALQALLSQTYTNIEVIICDNASTDSTQSIIDRFREKDDRIKYHRHTKNLGAALNYNSTFELSKGKYFKWAAHDDTVHASYIEHCVIALESDDSISVVQSLSGQIDENDKITDHQYTNHANIIPDNTPDYEQYRILLQHRGAWIRIFGVIRSSILKDTRLIDNYVGSDLTLLGELGLNGKVHDIEGVMFWRREHGHTSTTGEFKKRRKRLNWFDTSRNATITLPEWRLTSEMFSSIARQNMSFSSKLRCYKVVFGRMWIKKKLLIEDLFYASIDSVQLLLVWKKPKSNPG